MTQVKWKYQKAAGHHHVLIGKETLDVQNESDARLIALVPEMIEVIKKMDASLHFLTYLTILTHKIKAAEKK